MVYINKGDHEDPHGLPKDNLEHSIDTVYHADIPPKMPEEMEKLEYTYQHFQDHKKVYETDSQVTTEPIHDTLYPQSNNNIEYGLFKNVIDSYYLDNQIRDDFQCTKTFYTHYTAASTLHPNPPCTHTYDHISQQLDSLADTEQQQTLYANEADASLFTKDTATPCTFNIIPSDLETEFLNEVHDHAHNNTGIHFYSKQKHRDTFGDTHIQYHDFDNGDAFIYKDKYTALLQQELQNPFWCLHDPNTTQSYQISPNIGIETMPNTMYFTGNTSTVTKINHVTYQTIQYNDEGMFLAQLIMEQHLPSSHSVLTINILYYRNIQKQKALHPSTQEVVQSSCIFG